MGWVHFLFDSARDAADALSDALSDCGANAVTLEDNADEPLFEPALGETPLWESTRVVALFPAEQDVDQLRNILTALLAPMVVPPFKTEAVPDKDWEREWMTNFNPIPFGDKLWICPSWHTPPDPTAINIMLDPGLAFGTGTHPTTALCLRWLDAADVRGKTVIDYGCGSGILAIAAALLGAIRIIGIDTDPQALIATRDNAVRNKVEIETYLPEDCPDVPADIMLANILAGPLHTLAPTLSALTLPQGDIVLSGILDSQADGVTTCYSDYFTMGAPKQEAEWMRLVGVRHG